MSGDADQRVLLDASAVLAYLRDEPGAALVHDVLIRAAAAICAVNLAEVVGKLLERGMPEDDVAAVIADLEMQVLPFDAALAAATGRLRPATRGFGLSLADRACLACAGTHGLKVLTTDRIWPRAMPEAAIEVIRA